MLPEVENTCCKDRISFAILKHLNHVLQISRTTTGNHRDSHRLADRTG